MDAVRAYLESLSQSRGVGTAETSGYAALKALVDSVGAQVQPKITYVIHPAQQRGSLPDGGLYEKRKTLSPQPDRGAVEVKPATEAVAQTAQSEQALRYLRQFGLLLITNYWHFALYQLRDGAPELLDEFRLADDADHFWELASRPAKAARERGPALAEFLRRVCMASAPLDRPKIVAEFLASHARDALTTIEAAPDDAALTQVRKPLEDESANPSRTHSASRSTKKRAATSSTAPSSRPSSTACFPRGSSGTRASRGSATPFASTTSTSTSGFRCSVGF